MMPLPQLSVAQECQRAKTSNASYHVLACEILGSPAKISVTVNS